MPDIEFDEDKIYNQNLISNSMNHKKSGFSNWLVGHHLAKNSNQANIILLIIALALLGFAINTFIKLFKSQNGEVRYEVSDRVLQNLPEDVRQKITNQNAK